MTRYSTTPHNHTMNSLMKAIGKKLGRIGASVTTVDNKKNPASAYSMARRREAGRGRIAPNFSK